ncbi:30S ribosomal protein S5 [Patescibacteria group bacterium]|uniref:Small ribosomal subunit protein uS5 n=1 Tax=candidate division WWE3 bacterium TaxID=2053526 RepID=A0A928Y5E8_UNCKA|nr:30S ribosomal protein S5 [candidate division WWE3 bacterium]MCL4732770.1 30S ribosomal protein S5 [Patescibacteria group bacterium]MDL1952912.1 30S ribosomal protein S5 [Candidatus Uhrbacteria bacterium UHB]RIL00632.1 MAG: 30S ribosomal protein S5 [Candidatus Uhrbacteria bacterium]
MADEQDTKHPEPAADAENKSAEPTASDSGEKPSDDNAARGSANPNARSFRLRSSGRRGGPRRRGDRAEIPEQSDYEEKTLEIRRVTRVTGGGKRMRFRALSVVGNRKGRVGFGMGKGVDVPGTTNKASTKARKSLITVPIVNETIPHEVRAKFGSADVLMKPAPKGTGVKAGGAVRQVLELAGVPNVSAKMLGSGNKVNNVKATFKALNALRTPVLAESQKKSEGSASHGQSAE